ncbi:hypothetical protein PIB30_039814 [Stylosanthes scabra]|uniref:Secreted protein n=1 Tax=Stylosanthes scabra TaxID=79078 RepID=A0ABU6QDT0_9FABA|nr:hypothetical protein [Stylosanthes scabra]
MLDSLTVFVVPATTGVLRGCRSSLTPSELVAVTVVLLSRAALLPQLHVTAGVTIITGSNYRTLFCFFKVAGVAADWYKGGVYCVSVAAAARAYGGA